jgi:hypothetical protein
MYIPMKTKKSVIAATISAWEHDPGSGNQPDGGQLIEIPAPDLSNSTLPTTIENPSAAPEPKIYPLASAEFRYWSAAASLSRASDYWSKQLPALSWQVGAVLPVDLYYGDNLNAYYDRVGLRFFQGNVGSRTFYSCDSPDVVCHEHGHAVLDSIKPQLWDAASIEVAAFHESFGDISAILCALQVPSLRLAVLAETGNAIYRNSRLSRLAEQLGWAIRQSSPTSVDPDSLRNAVNAFFYQDPDTLPSYAPAHTLSSEPHSFSRVFTSAFFEGLANMFKSRPTADEANLLQVSLDMGKILVIAIQSASVVPAFFSQVAVSMMQVAQSQFPKSTYVEALKSGFLKHGIVSPANSAVFSFAALKKNKVNATLDQKGGKELPKLSLAVREYGLGTDNIVVHSAAESTRYNITGADIDVGAIESAAEDVAAKSFLEDLLRRGRLKLAVDVPSTEKAIVSAVNETKGHERHTHELRRDGKDLVLKRVRIDCHF